MERSRPGTQRPIIWMFIILSLIVVGVALARYLTKWNTPIPKVNSKDGLKYVWIPPRTFQMGCSPDDKECGDDEKPMHPVTISKGFWIGQTEVTLAAYKAYAVPAVESAGEFYGLQPSGQKGDQYPVVFVSWYDAAEYCSWAGGRLPTEAEWEYAARGGSPNARYGKVDDIAWTRENSGNTWHPVAQLRANGFGLFDVLGNVSEWVTDWDDENYYKTSPAVDPQGPSSSPYPDGQIPHATKVLRGGEWGLDRAFARVSARTYAPRETKAAIVGFRCIVELGNP
jgi:sulfatase modifying factor 1